MKEYKNIDELIRTEAEGFQIEPSADLWTSIMTEASNKGLVKKRSNLKWLLLSILLLFMGVAPLYYYFIGISESEILVSNNNESIKQLSKGIELMNIDETSNRINNNTSSQTNQQTNLTSSISDEEISINKIVDNNEIENNNAGTIITSNKNEYDLNKYPSGNNSLFYDASRIENLFGKSIIVNNDIQKIYPLSIYSIAYSDTMPLNRKLSLDEYVEKRRRIHMYTGLSAKAAMIYYPNTSDQFTYTTGAHFGIKLSDFYIETAVSYQSMKERGVYKLNYKSNDSIGYYNKVESFEIDPINPDNITYKTITTTVYDSVNHYNLQSPQLTYNYLKIPLKFGYKLINKGKFNMGIETALIFSTLLNSEIPNAEFNYPEYTLINIEDKTPERVDINLQFAISLRFNYKLANSISLSAQPEFTKYLNSIYDVNKGGPNTKPYTMGLRIGIFYDF